MNIIFRIAARELRAYFSTYSGYMILAAHLLLTGLLFNVYAVGDTVRFSTEVLEAFFYFSSGMAVLTGILLSMRLIAEERQTQTLVLLRSAPVTERQVVWGKFFSALAVLCLTLLVSLYLPALVMLNGKVSLGHVLTGYLGLLLIGGASIAITLLASVWSPNQLIAGVTGAFMVALLIVVWMLARVTEEPLKQLFSYLALHNMHFMGFSKGILDVGDVLYYGGVILLFVEGSAQAMLAWRWRE